MDLQDQFLPLAEFPEVASRTPVRGVQSALWNVDNNLHVVTMVWEDYASMAAEDGGGYRGTELPPAAHAAGEGPG